MLLSSGLAIVVAASVFATVRLSMVRGPGETPARSRRNWMGVHN
jgi:hypothetical protein